MNSNSNMPRANRSNFKNFKNKNKNKINNQNRNNINQVRRLRRGQRLNYSNRNPMLNRINKNVKNTIKVNQPKSVNFKIKNENKNIHIKGKDLVLPLRSEGIPDNGLYAILPANPAYWNSTRIKNIAILNQYYKPTKMILEYVPSVSKFQKGTITIGTISNMTMQDQDIQSMLIASTSGGNYSCSNNFSKYIQLNQLLQQNKFLISSKVDKESVPFYIIVHLSDIKDENGEFISPGNFYINYEYIFYNPISKPLSFNYDQNILIKDFNKDYKNITLVLTEVNSGYEIGTIIDVEYINNRYVYLYNGSEVQLYEESRASVMYSVLDNIPQNFTLDLTSYTKVTDQPATTVVEASNFLIVVLPNDNRIIIRRVVTTTTVNLPINSYFKIIFEFPDELKNIPLLLYSFSEAPNTWLFNANGYRLNYLIE